MLTFGEVCAGVGGMSRGLIQAGMTPRWFVEWDRDAAGVLALHHRDTPIYCDLYKFYPNEKDHAIDVLVGGTSCQNLSMAGDRSGLDGEQSRVFYQMVRIGKRLRVRYLQWENVAGALSSNNGLDFAAIIRAFTGVPVEVPADGWGNAGFVPAAFPCRWNVAWRVFDSQYFGVAQRRRRVFLVGSLGDASCVEILFEPESVRGDSPPSRPSRSGASAAVEGGARGSGGAELAKCLGASDGGVDREDRHTLVPEVAGALNFGAHPGGVTGQDAYGNLLVPEIADCLQTRDSKGPDTKTKTGHLIPVAFDTTQITHPENRSNPQAGAPCHSLPANGHPPAVAFNWRAGGKQTTIGMSEEVANTLQGPQAQGVAIPIQEVGRRTGTSSGLKAGDGVGAEGDPMFTLQARAQHGVAVAFKPSHYTRDKDGAPSEVTPPLTADADKGDQDPVIFQTRIARNGRGQPESICPALTGTNAGDTSDMRPVVASPTYGVRRLTPRECERLQAWPDDYSEKRIGLKLVGNEWKPTGRVSAQKDSARYKQAGNGVTSSVARWIAERIIRFSK